jgi:DNA invertase Pin-like site-specific DNA recombinase
MKGDSFRRQSDLAERYAVAHGLDLDTTLTFQDLGKSAFRGANLETGQLGTFLQAVRDGLVAEGSWLLVESLDRISRQKPRKALRTLEDILEAGVTLVTLTDGKVYTADALDDDPMALMWALMVAIRANEESAMKSRRVAAAWVGKRQKASESGKPLTARTPGWLRVEAGRFVVIEERAEVIRRIFRMTLEGAGRRRIVNALNAEKVPVFGTGAFWHDSYVMKVLSNPAVAGTLVPYRTVDAGGKRQRSALEPIQGHFPAVVGMETFERVQAMVSGRGLRDRTKGRRAPVHLFAGLARCPHCDSSMVRINKGSSNKAGKPHVVCTKAHTRAGCTYKAVHLDILERAVLDNWKHVLGQAPSGDPTLDAEFERVEGMLSALDDEIVNLAEALAAGFSPALRAKLDTAERQVDELQRQRNALIERASKASSPILGKKLADLETAFGAPQVDVPATNALLRQLLTAVVIDYPDGTLRFRWQHGGESQLLYAMPAES